MSAKEELRCSIVTLHRAGHSNSDIVKLLKNVKTTYKTVYNVVKRYKETGGTSDRPRSGRPRSARTPQLKRSVREKIRRNSKRSIRQMAKDHGVAYGTMHSLVTKDLGCSSYRMQKRHVLSEATKEKRLDRSRKMLNVVKSGTKPAIIFSDEKLFNVEIAFNPQNDRILSQTTISQVPVNEKSVFKRQKPASVMVWAAVTSDGKKSPLIFVPEGVKISGTVYLDMLEKNMLPWLKKCYGNKSYIFQQDGAPAHTSNKVQQWCKENLSGFWDKLIWPPSSPDLNVMDYSIWSMLEGRACNRNHRSVAELKASLRREWKKITEEEIRVSCGGFRRRLEAVVASEGSYIENT